MYSSPASLSHAPKSADDRFSSNSKFPLKFIAPSNTILSQPSVSEKSNLIFPAESHASLKRADPISPVTSPVALNTAPAPLTWSKSPFMPECIPRLNSPLSTVTFDMSAFE